MRKLIALAAISVSLIFATATAAQRLFIKPYYGYLRPSMGDVNDRITHQIDAWRQILGEPIPSPGKIDGRNIFGAQIQYNLNDDYFLLLDVSRYKDEAVAEYMRPNAFSERFFYQREVKSLTAVLYLNYSLDYDPASRLNKYIGIGAGLISAEANSNTRSSFVTDDTGALLELVDTQGEFSGNSLMAAVTGGLEWRLLSLVLVWCEAGYQYAKLGQLKGTVTSNQQNSTFTSNTSFDFSGFYFHAGLGIGLPF
jgi:opacity protein-like surface antigen